MVHPGQLLAPGSLDRAAGLVLVDLAVGTEVEQARTAHPGTPIVVVVPEETTGQITGALDAGAIGYLKHPVCPGKVPLVLPRWLKEAGVPGSRVVPSRTLTANSIQEFVGEHPAIVSAREAAQKIAGADSTPVLLLGEDGTGKHLLARIIHGLSARAAQPFLVAHCTKLSDRLLDAELFGQAAGAGREPDRAVPGLIERAEGGTLLLDDVTELPASLQLRLLRLLEEEPGVPEREGGGRPMGVRLMAASTLPLERAVEDGVLHRDLCARLGVFPIILPPLRDRRQDILALARHFVEGFNAELRRRVHALEPEAGRRLVRSDWPGNVRELRNAIERAMILETSEVLHAEYLPFQVATTPRTPGPLSFVQLPAQGVTLDAVERELVRQALARVGGNQVRAAGLLGISRDALRNRMKKFGLGSGRRGTR